MRTNVEEILYQEIAIHPRCSKDHGEVWTGAAHVYGKVIINGEEYEFDRVINVEFEKPERQA